MGIFNKMWSIKNTTTETVNQSDWFTSLIKSRTTTSGEKVTKESALTISGVYACTDIIASSISKLPIHIYQKNKDGSNRVDNDVSYLLEKRPNLYMTPSTFKQTLTVKLLLDGNTYVWVERRRGKAINLWILNNVQVLQDYTTGEIIYKATLNNKPYTFFNDEIIHIKSLSTDGILGKSKIDILRETIGNMQSSRKLLGNYFKNGTTTSGVVTYPEKLNSDAKAEIRRQWQENNSGYDNAGKVAVLDLGLEYKEINSLKFTDQQFLESTKFTLEEIARVFKVPLHMINSLDRSTFNNIEQQSLDFYMNTILPLLLQIEEEFNYKLFSSTQREKYFIKFNMEGALRGDSATRSTYYEKMINLGVYSINEVRKLENMNSIGIQGDTHRVDLNHVDIKVANDYQLGKANSKKKGGEIDNE
ncbi:phage portal protein [Clostridium botulinum]|uniref:Phage portal protein, HK97 family n=4 Tax=Clostridium botulinum TaxID=1491 RepID=C1FP67_CLOBJ|nr:phage portal protein [Clostridium botulinum]ACO86721.1 phage portal protein, HK97 family [Clostridium botulinum A2 str. Kyoto]AUN07012.1 phage portal protein [Clostridium botulinum]MBN3364737.1 phage portal protein [Clostridium botulinum]MBN3373714.1 phage portal protein [Clostridium botulinum]MBN3385493.1 phage portal protein [Clostridium botulinum]